MDFGIKPSGLTQSAPYEMKGVSADPERPHILHIRHLGVSNPAIVNAMFRGERIEHADVEQCAEQLVTCGGITWEGHALSDGEPTPDNVRGYFASCIKEGFSVQVLLAWLFASNAANYGIAKAEPEALGEASPPV